MYELVERGAECMYKILVVMDVLENHKAMFQAIDSDEYELK